MRLYFVIGLVVFNDVIGGGVCYCIVIEGIFFSCFVIILVSGCVICNGDSSYVCGSSFNIEIVWI